MIQYIMLLDDLTQKFHVDVKEEREDISGPRTWSLLAPKQTVLKQWLLLELRYCPKYLRICLKTLSRGGQVICR